MATTIPRKNKYGEIISYQIQVYRGRKHTFLYIANANEFREKLLKEIDMYKEREMKKYINLIHH